MTTRPEQRIFVEYNLQQYLLKNSIKINTLIKDSRQIPDNWIPKSIRPQQFLQLGHRILGMLSENPNSMRAWKGEPGGIDIS